MLYSIFKRIILSSFFILSTFSSEIFSQSVDNIVLDTSTVEFVAVVTRHGSRSPLSNFSSNDYPYWDLKYWPYGKEQLTALGRLETLEAGRVLRKKYKSLVGTRYDKRNVLIAYNPFPRDYDSALCTLYGLYPTKKHDRLCYYGGIEDSLVKRDFDVAEFLARDKCIAYKIEARRLVGEFDRHESVKEENQKLLKYLSIHTKSNLNRVSDVYPIYDILSLQFQEGYFQPKWSYNVFPEPIRGLAIQMLSTLSGGSPLLVRLGPAPILKDILDKMMAKVKGTPDVNKMYIEVTHDVTVLSLINALRANITKIEVATGGFIEFQLHLYRHEYFVKVEFYHDSRWSSPIEIEIKACPRPCSLETFHLFVHSIQPIDHEEECQQF